ncbi:MAG: hypothetical protein JNM65_16245 [Verrucomicrobiaceae bacterium]|nr:hypothetical protein [Verrucomicrobiaceae bacterium]
MTEIDAKFEKDSVELALAPYLKAVSDLNRQYLAALDRVVTTAKQRGNAAEIQAVEQERDSVQAGNPVPKIDYLGTHPTVANTRLTYRGALKLIERERDGKMRPIISRHSSARRELIMGLLKSGRIDEVQALQSTMKPLYPSILSGNERLIGNWKVYFNDRREAVWTFKKSDNKYFDATDGTLSGSCVVKQLGKFVVYSGLGYWVVTLTSDKTIEGVDPFGDKKFVGERVP